MNGKFTGEHKMLIGCCVRWFASRIQDGIQNRYPKWAKQSTLLSNEINKKYESENTWTWKDSWCCVTIKHNCASEWLSRGGEEEIQIIHRIIRDSLGKYNGDQRQRRRQQFKSIFKRIKISVQIVEKK